MVEITNKQQWKHAYRDITEALERIEAVELKGMTDEEALRRMRDLSVVGTPWQERPEWSGLVEQQAIFHSRKKR